MKSVEAFECQYCKTLYRTLSGMNSCESACLKAKQEEQTQEDLKTIRAELQNYVRLNAESIQDVEDCLKNNEDFCKLFSEKSRIKAEEIESDQFVKELDTDIQTLQDRMKELQVQLTNTSKLKHERIKVLTAPLQKEVDKMWYITENDFGIPRPHNTL